MDGSYTLHPTMLETNTARTNTTALAVHLLACLGFTVSRGDASVRGQITIRKRHFHRSTSHAGMGEMAFFLATIRLTMRAPPQAWMHAPPPEFML
jgi:hypothetical protein